MTDDNRNFYADEDPMGIAPLGSNLDDDTGTTIPRDAIKLRTLTLGEIMGSIRIDIQVDNRLMELGKRLKTMSLEDRAMLEAQITRIGESLLTISTGFRSAYLPTLEMAERHQRRLIEEALLKAELQDDAPPE